MSNSRSARTRAAIIDAALDLFHREGYEATTMRAIAAQAGVSVGNTYYYFESKDHLIQAFYGHIQDRHTEEAAVVLDSETDLGARMLGVIDAWLTVAEPYRAFAGTFFKVAADPNSPLSPFSPESAATREAAIDIWRQVVTGSDTKVPRALRQDLPELLWMFLMAVVLLWVHDPTEGAIQTRTLVSRMVPIVVRMIGLARVPVLRSTADDLAGLLGDFKTFVGMAN